MTVAAARPTRSAMPALRRRREIERFALLGAWVFLILLFGALAPDSFLTWRNFTAMFGSQAVLVVLTLGLLVPLTAGDFDLSGASILVLASMLVAVLNVSHGWPIGAAILAAVLVGMSIGVVNAFFILYFRIPSLIVTLGVSTFVNGGVLWLSDSQTVSGVSMGLVEWVVIRRLFGIPLAFFYAIALALILWYVLEFTIAGRKLLFTGRGQEVARLNGVNVVKVRVVAFVTSGAVAALGGVLYAGMTGSADPLSGLSFLLPAFAAAFLGATTIRPGRFNPIGTLISVYFLVTGITGLTILGAQAYVQNLFYGGALVVAVALSQIVRGRQAQSFN